MSTRRSRCATASSSTAPSCRRRTSTYPRFLKICRRHDIEISATRVRAVMKHFEAERAQTRAWRKILEQTTGALLGQVAQVADR